MPGAGEEPRAAARFRGPGKFRGGLGIDLEVRNFVDGKWNFERANRRGCPRGDCGEANQERAAAIIWRSGPERVSD